MNISMLRGHFNEAKLDSFFHQKGVLTDYENVFSDIEKIIRMRDKISDTLLNARVFINNGTRDDFGYSISNNPPQDGESLHHWLERITDAESFCAVINGINGWSDNLATRIKRDFNDEWVKNFGIPSQGIDVYTFMGKYNLTPFGIHKDQEHTFLYHLGPGIKKAWVWNPNIIDITPFIRANAFNLEETLSHAYAVTLKPGDALFIPQNWFHVLENPEFSVTLGVTPYEKKKSELLVSFLKDMLVDNIDDDKNIHISIQDIPCEATLISDVIPSALYEQTLSQITESGIIQLVNKLRSNHFFKYSSPSRNAMGKGYRYFGDIIIGEDDGKVTQLYCRGKMLLIKSEFKDRIAQFINLINTSGLYYDNDNDNDNNFMSFFIKKLISFGVLV